MDKNYWRNYYKSHKIGEKPSLFAEFVLGRLKGDGAGKTATLPPLRDSNKAESAESRRSERAESAEPHTESLKDSSDKIDLRVNPHDSHDFYNNEATLHNAKSHKNSDITLLELGCGNGRDAIFFAKNGIKVIAIDQVADEISYLASLYAENPHFVSGDFTDLNTIFKGLDSHSASPLSSLRGDNSPKQSMTHISNKIDCQIDAIAESRNDNSPYRHCEHSQNVKQSIYENNLVESRRSERAESAESHTESNAELRKDSSDSAESSDFNLVDSHNSTMPNLVTTAKGDCTKSHKGDSTHSARFHCIYSRFTLHSITHSQQEILLSQIPRYLAKDGILAIEARGLKNSLYQKGEAVIDEADAFIYDSHYRRFVDLERLCEVLRSLDFRIEFAKEERGFAPFNGEDDYFFRIIATRGGAELVFFVCFQPRIFTLYASTKWHKPLENVA